MRAALATLLLSLSACAEGGPAAGGSATAVASSAPTSLTHGAAKELALTWAEPPGWKKVPPSSPMRNASYEVPAASGDPEPGDFGVSFFGPDKEGVVRRNTARWIEQFKDASGVQKSDRSVGGLVQHVVEIASGTYESGMPGGPTTPKPGYALLGAIVETPKGSHYFKLVGPKATVAAAREAFFALLDTVRPRA